MEENQIIERLEKIFSSVFGKESIVLTRTTSAGDIAEWNSLNHMILISEVETAFNLEFKFDPGVTLPKCKLFPKCTSPNIKNDIIPLTP